MFFSKIFRAAILGEGFLFQSLFSWMFFSKFRGNRDAHKFWVSILVLLDVFLEVNTRRESARALEFQSLFSWMFFSKCRCCDHSDHAARVSILVLLDVFLEVAPIRFHVISLRVSILVLLDVFLEDGLDKRQGYRKGVSILVLLDVFLEAIPPPAIPESTRGFNPCSLGCFSRRPALETLPVCIREFQSLFSWMFFSKHNSVCF